MVEDGFNLATDDQVIRIDIAALTGQRVTVYGQTEVTRDLIAAAPGRGFDIVFEAGEVTLHDIDGSPWLTYVKDGATHRLDADFVTGCDGFHGPSRRAIPADGRCEYGRASGTNLCLRSEMRRRLYPPRTTGCPHKNEKADRP